MNEVQIEILHRLVLSNGSPFRVLARGYTYEDNVVYHIKQLIKNNLVSKRGLKYYLTTDGLIKSSDIDFNSIKVKKYKELYVSFVCFYKDRYLVTSKNYNNKITYKLSGEKPFIGEKKDSYLDRLLYDEIGIHIENSKFKFQCEQLRTIKSSKNKVLFDNILHVYEAELSEGEFLKTELKHGNKWILKSEISSLTFKWPEVDICILNNGSDKIYEYEYLTNYIIDDADL